MNLIRFTRPSTVACNTHADAGLQNNALESELDRLFSAPFGSLLGQSFGEQTPVDIHEDEKAVQIRVELPGARREDIQIETTRDRLQVRATRKLGFGERAREQNFERSYRLGEQLDSNAVSANYENGVLLVTLSKKQSEQPRKIAVN